MKLRKPTLYSVIITILVLVVFNLVCFITPLFTNSSVFWICYAFATAAIVVEALVIGITANKPGLKSKFFGLPILRTVWICFGTTIVLSLVYMMIEIFVSVPVWIVITSLSIVLVTAIIMLLTMDLAIDHIKKTDEHIRVKVLFIKSTEVKVRVCISKTETATVKKELFSLMEAIRYSDPMTNNDLESIEDDISLRVDNLPSFLSNENDAVAQIKRIKELLEERNEICKISK